MCFRTNWGHFSKLELEFGNVGFWGEGKTGVPGGKPLGTEKRTNNKLNPHMTPGPGIEPGTHWWEASGALSPLRHPCSPWSDAEFTHRTLNSMFVSKRTENYVNTLVLFFCFVFFSLPYGTKHFREEDTERHITPSVRCEIIWKRLLNNNIANCSLQYLDSVSFIATVKEIKKYRSITVKNHSDRNFQTD